LIFYSDAFFWGLFNFSTPKSKNLVSVYNHFNNFFATLVLAAFFSYLRWTEQYPLILIINPMDASKEKQRRRIFRRKNGEHSISKQKEILQYTIVILVIAGIVILAYMVT
jgi:hypothetical protein